MKNVEKKSLSTVPELSKQLNITERAIRFYESKGLVYPQRIGNTRVFNYKDRARLIIIIRAKKLGFSLSEIKDYLELYDVDKNHQRQADFALKNVRDKIELLEDQREEIGLLLGDLRELETQLGDLAS
tara:strand:- start:880 stop:1263 length:384 start_codon:yes stop_codon:yes gene_type:complete